MSDNTTAAGVGRPFEHKGTTYTVKPLSVGGFCQFEAWLKAGALGEIERTRHLLTDAVYKDALQVATRDLATHQYAWGGELFAKAVRTVPGFRKLLELSVVDGMDEEVSYEISRTRPTDLAVLLRELNPGEL